MVIARQIAAGCAGDLKRAENRRSQQPERRDWQGAGYATRSAPDWVKLAVAGATNNDVRSRRSCDRSCRSTPDNRTRARLARLGIV